ncbi:sigma-54 interaction domain-containing protein [Anaerosphaera multitolerans]|uniref:AAA family ATPase n=1 Tax=Anaerosphaera multitolerans TaxID=2487351 RepID=A0A437S6P5_9FIRM|nr:sigma 54-interacting transcriptional regulator [Anaerosphaera multitolerans]RVU54690.1 AAA family ATPase [Anaerosphaera multitolerans]
MYNLKNIQSSTQEVAEAIKAILSTDVTIINQDLIRIAATGRYKSFIGEQLSEGCSYEFILKSKKPERIVQKEISSRCKNCSSLNSCEEIATIGYPIIDFNDEPIGVIGLIAFTQEQHDYIFNNLHSINTFLGKLSFLLAGNLQYEEMIEDLLLKNKEINNLINSLESGIIITDDKNNIKNYNKKALQLLNCKDSELNNINITKVFSNINLEKLYSQQVARIDNTFNKSYDEFIIKAVENQINNNTKSYLFEISKYSNAIIDAYNILESKNNIDFNHILGQSTAMKNTITLAKQVAKSDSSIMIRGESGTGKELFARAIHNNSLRKNNPFVAINCSSIPDSLLESELFGYEKGAFSGASNTGKIGRFELANKGTLFLDEIGDLPIHLQPKLLRVLQDGSFTRLGGNKTIKVNFRLITATNRNLENMIENNEFRDDLYYRLNVIPINVPSLRDRKDDIPIIANYKLREYCERLNKNEKTFSDKIIEIFKKFYWKGNVRELENIVEYLVNISNEDEITDNLLPYHFHSNSLIETTERNSKENFMSFLDDNTSLKKCIENFEKQLLEKYINRFGNSTKNKQKIADILEINLSTLYRKLYKYDIF